MWAGFVSSHKTKGIATLKKLEAVTPANDLISVFVQHYYQPFEVALFMLVVYCQR